MKKTRQIMTATLVQNSAARWHSICQNLSTQTIKKTKREKSNNNKKTPHTPTPQKKNLKKIYNNQVKAVKILT
jgi:hypothetical protein